MKRRDEVHEYDPHPELDESPETYWREKWDDLFLEMSIWRFIAVVSLAAHLAVIAGAAVGAPFSEFSIGEWWT